MKRSLSVPKNLEFVKLVQQQKLADNSLIIEDSLFALSKRVVQIQSTVNKEISAIRNNLQTVTDILEQRQTNKRRKNNNLL